MNNQIDEGIEMESLFEVKCRWRNNRMKSKEKKETFVCNDCEEVCDMDDFSEEVDRGVCRECVDRFYQKCNDCGKVYHQDDDSLFHSEIDGKYYCEDCYSENFTNCECCNIVMWRGEARWINGCAYCDDCHSENEESERWNCLFEFREGISSIENKSKRFVGIEIEAKGGDSSLVRKECGSFVSCVSDGSIDDDGGDEFVSNPTNNDLLYRDIRKLCKSIRNAGYYIDSMCGLHIHLDIRDILENDKKKLHMAYRLFEKFFFEMVSPSRRNNSYCRFLREDYEKLFDRNFKNYLTENEGHVPECDISCYRYDGRRYDWANLNSSYVRGSIEIRNHGGTIDSVKIINWIRIHNTFIDWVLKTDIKRLVNIKPLLRTFYHIIDNDGENSDLIKYIQKRRRKFNKKLSRTKIVNVKQRLDSQTPIDSMERFYREPPFVLPYIRDICEIFRKEYNESLYRAERKRMVFRIGKTFFDIRTNTQINNFDDMIYSNQKRFKDYLIYLSRKGYNDKLIDGIPLNELLTSYFDLTSKGKEVGLKRYIRRLNKNVRNTIYKTIK